MPRYTLFFGEGMSFIFVAGVEDLAEAHSYAKSWLANRIKGETGREISISDLVLEGTAQHHFNDGEMDFCIVYWGRRHSFKVAQTNTLFID